MTVWLDAPLATLSLHDLDFSRAPSGRPARARLRPAVFLDKDGTLTVPDDGAITDPARLRLMPGAGEALARLQAAGLALVLVTNESGIARGAFTRVQFAGLQAALVRRLKDDFGVTLDDVAVCPHAPDAQIRGRVISIYGSVGRVGEAGPQAIISINRGRADKIEVGHVLALYSLGGTVRDVTKPVNAPDALIKLPDERAGLAFVFRVFDRVSYALVMNITRPVSPLDVVQTP